MQSPEKMEMLKSRIDRMNKTQHTEILRILRKNPDVKLNENKNGVFINLSWLPPETVTEIEEYVHLVDVQESALLTAESQKEAYKNVLGSYGTGY